MAKHVFVWEARSKCTGVVVCCHFAADIAGSRKKECRAALFLRRYLNMDVLKKIYKGQQKEKNYGCD